MRVEDFCQHLLRDFLPQIDPQRSGVAFDVGVGTFSFYCETFAKLGFRTIAVEPLPVKEVYELCARRGITLIESAISDSTGTTTMYIGEYDGVENLNLNSLRPDWWGNSHQTKQVTTITLPMLWERAHADHVTCLKIDTEGSESVILIQLAALLPASLPDIVMFEYGGGSSRASERGAWSQNYLDSTLTCLHSLQQCGYQHSLIIDSDAPLRSIDLQNAAIDADSLFVPDSHYGNFICFRSFQPDSRRVIALSERYRVEVDNWVIRFTRRMRNLLS